MAELTNYHTIRYGQADGELTFGQIHQDNNLSAVMLRNGRDPVHFISLDATGESHRAGGTICKSPGSFQVSAGGNVTPGDPGIFLDSGTGDIVIRAAGGRVRIEASYVDIKATKEMRVEAKEQILMDSRVISVTAGQSLSLVSENTVNVLGKAILNIYGGLIDAADGATSVKGSKCGSYSNEERNK